MVDRLEKIRTRREKNGKLKSGYFIVPHGFYESEDCSRDLTPEEQNFFVILCKLSNRLADENGWFWHIDKVFISQDGKRMGFESFGISSSVCKSARKKLIRLKIIQYRRGSRILGQFRASQYRIPCLSITPVENHGLNQTMAIGDSNPSPWIEISSLLKNRNKKEFNNGTKVIKTEYG